MRWYSYKGDTITTLKITNNLKGPDIKIESAKFDFTSEHHCKGTDVAILRIDASLLRCMLHSPLSSVTYTLKN